MKNPLTLARIEPATFRFVAQHLNVNETMWKYVIEPDKRQMTIWHIHITYWVPTATNTHSQYVILTAFTL